MSDAWWTWVGIAVAVVFVGMGAWLVLASRRDARAAASRPARDSFRREEEAPAPPKKQLAVVLNPTKLDGDGSTQKATIAGVCADQGWAEPLFLPTTEHDVGFGQTRQALEEKVDVVCAFGGDGTVRAVAQEMIGT
ncbi:MAG TPA: diacylglycerol kinase family protein, partial [Ornithinibacter sp.]|nr:diacylglycerol kinase family protein [Ornithinibacter sp.]